MNRASWGLLLGVVIVGLVLPGCVNIPRANLEVRRYSLGAPVIPEPPDTEYPGAAARALAGSLSVLLPAFTADASQRGERMLFRPEDNRMDYYFYHRWIASPEKMLEDILASELGSWGVCGGGIYRGAAGLIPDYEIGGRLAALYADNREDQEAAVLEVVLTVVRINPGTLERSVVFQKTYTENEPRKNDRIDSFVAAANRAVEHWLTKARPDLEAVLRGETPR